MALDVPKWLKEDLELSDEQITQIAPIFQANGRAEKLEKGYLRQQDYSRRMDEGRAEIQRREQELAAANEALTQEMLAWGETQKRGEAITKAQQQRMEKAEADVLRLTQAVQRTADQYGFDATSVIGAAAPPQAPMQTTPPPPSIDTSKFVERDALGNVVDAMVNLAPELMVIAQEHQELTGTRLDPRTLIAELRTRAQTKGNRKSLDIRDIWSEMHDVPAKRAEADRAKYEADIKAAEERGRVAALSQQAVPGAPSPGRVSPAFMTPSGGTRTSVLNRPQAGGTVQRAAAALAAARAQRAPARGATT
jgi:hypothetical protein